MVLKPEVQLQYDLPDIKVLDSKSDFSFMLWRPDTKYIVLGRANSIDKSVITKSAYEDSIRIVKRPSGGESVILTPEMIVFSAKLTFNEYRNPSSVFKDINSNLISSLTQLGIKNLASKGISDISIGDRKIIGSSMYLKGNQLFYHAVLNVNEDVKQISRYLKHPGREPDYRQGRDHEQFVTSIYKEGYNLDYISVERSITNAFTNLFAQYSSKSN